MHKLFILEFDGIYYYYNYGRVSQFLLVAKQGTATNMLNIIIFPHNNNKLFVSKTSIIQKHLKSTPQMAHNVKYYYQMCDVCYEDSF